MEYKQICEGVFKERPNRFIAYCDIDGVRTKVHVKNTGRCGELLLPDARVYLEKSDNPTRSTAYDLVAVWKGMRLVNMDSQAPNKVVQEWLEDCKWFEHVTKIKPECVYGNSRFDFYVETENEKIFIEVKGVTREQDNVVCFPDAPSERAIKHVEELRKAKQDGYRVMVLFVVQMEEVFYFTPDTERHQAFCDALIQASKDGVEIRAVECAVTPESLRITKEVPVSLTGEPPVQMIENRVDLGTLIAPLEAWFLGNHRELPWRSIPTPYRVWVSEIMLQQTRVEAVKPYFARFMETLPTIQDLSKAKEEVLLKLWEGLGYYNRVRNLQKAAQEICASYQGEMPGNYEALLGLPGIGTYTAGAISSIAFDLPYPAVDGNVLRVLSRVRMDDRDIADSKVKTSIEQELLPVMKLGKPGNINQGFMELGATVCVPGGAPLCEKCPFEKVCMAHQVGKELEFPKKSGKKPRAIEPKTVLIIGDKTGVAIRKRPDKGLLAGLYELPMIEGHLSKKAVTEYLIQNGIQPIQVKPLPDGKHIFSHKEWHMKGYQIKVDELEQMMPSDKLGQLIFADKEEIQKTYPIPSAFEVYYKYLNIKQGMKSK